MHTRLTISDLQVSLTVRWSQGWSAPPNLSMTSGAPRWTWRAGWRARGSVGGSRWAPVCGRLLCLGGASDILLLLRSLNPPAVFCWSEASNGSSEGTFMSKASANATARWVAAFHSEQIWEQQWCSQFSWFWLELRQKNITAVSLLQMKAGWASLNLLWTSGLWLLISVWGDKKLLKFQPWWPAEAQVWVNENSKISNLVFVLSLLDSSWAETFILFCYQIDISVVLIEGSLIASSFKLNKQSKCECHLLSCGQQHCCHVWSDPGEAWRGWRAVVQELTPEGLHRSWE